MRRIAAPIDPRLARVVRAGAISEMSTANSNSSRPGDVARTTRQVYRTLSMSSVGLELGLAVVLGLLFGRWLDGQLGTAPWMMLVFLLIGSAAGFKGIHRMLRESDRAAKEKA
jgi:ATP synthase protein I